MSWLNAINMVICVSNHAAMTHREVRILLCLAAQTITKQNVKMLQLDYVDAAANNMSCVLTISVAFTT